MSEVVTGDAVVLEVRVAQLPTRALAVLIDLLVQWTVLIGVFVLLSMFASVSDPALFAAANILLVVLVTVGYPVAIETLTRGRSLGKMALGLRVVSDDGSPERFRQALFRGLAGFVEFWIFYGAPALICSLVSQQGKRLGDVFAGTIVISERGPRDTSTVIQMPPQLAQWASTLELSQLPDDVAAAARQYLLRWHELSPAVQHEMGTRIANQVASRIAPPPPPGVPPHAYLSAVLAERRRRAQVRLARQAGTGHPAPPPPRPAYAPAYPAVPPPAPPPAPLAAYPMAPPPAPFAPPAQPYRNKQEPEATPGGFAPPV
ncbi:RDD family protein [Thermoactinospora rubra]|uniref:RDD family protein n=1 Tax=Thermoactinospora rubra TaxID=1088767 RepID=UPI000A1221B7|nr:RDD family protein [Thermoactinospora rubra]